LSGNLSSAYGSKASRYTSRINFGNVNFTTPNQELLLKAALLSKNEGITAWREWRDAAKWEEDLDPESFHLLPLLYINLQKHGVDDPAMKKLKGIYRQAWSKNQALFHKISPVIRRLQNAGIRTMLLEGAGMSLLYHKNNGARPMAHIDVLVPWEQVRLALSMLYQIGWMASIPILETDIHYGHTIQLTHNTHGEFDLHWRPLHWFGNRYAQDFWDSALSVRMIDVDTLAPNPTDMLFHGIVHGMPWNPLLSIHWIADAITLINSPEIKINWERLIRFTEKHLLCLRLKTGLKYLIDNFQPSIPPEVMSTVKALPLTYLEGMEQPFWPGNLKERNINPYRALCSNFCQYRRLTAESDMYSIFGFPRYLMWRLEAKSCPELIFKGIRRTLEMLLSRPFSVRPR
jgi:hypothetical protein